MANKDDHKKDEDTIFCTWCNYMLFEFNSSYTETRRHSISYSVSSVFICTQCIQCMGVGRGSRGQTPTLKSRGTKCIWLLYFLTLETVCPCCIAPVVAFFILLFHLSAVRQFIICVVFYAYCSQRLAFVSFAGILVLNSDAYYTRWRTQWRFAFGAEL